MSENRNQNQNTASRWTCSICGGAINSSRNGFAVYAAPSPRSLYIYTEEGFFHEFGPLPEQVRRVHDDECLEVYREMCEHVGTCCRPVSDTEGVMSVTEHGVLDLPPAFADSGWAFMDPDPTSVEPPEDRHLFGDSNSLPLAPPKKSGQ